MKLLITFTLVLCCSAWALEPFTVDDQALLSAGSGNPHGAFWRTYRPVNAMSYTSPVSGRSTLWAQHLICPANHGQIEAILSQQFEFQQMLPPCAAPDSVVRFRVEGTIAFSSTRLDSVEDQLSMPMAVEYFTVPYSGETRKHLQFRRDGEIVDFLRRGLLSGDAFVLRIVAEPGNGIAVNTAPHLLRFYYTTDEHREEDFTESGDTGVYLSLLGEEPSHPCIRAAYTSVLGPDRWVVVTAYGATGQRIMARRLLVPETFPLSGTLTVSVLPEFAQQNKFAVFQLNEEDPDAACVCSSVVMCR